MIFVAITTTIYPKKLVWGKRRGLDIFWKKVGLTEREDWEKFSKKVVPPVDTMIYNVYRQPCL